MNKFNIIIPTFNSLSNLKKCLDSIYFQSYLHFHIIIVDNGSSDGTKNYILNNYPEIELISLPKNYGFAKACNIGIKISNCPYISLINDDVILDKDFFKNINETIIEHPEGMAFCPKILKINNPRIIDNLGDEISSKTGIRHIGEGKIDIMKYNVIKEVFLIPATASVYRGEFFLKVGYFDEKFNSYFEDADLSFRGQILGCKYFFNSKAKAYHQGKATSSIYLKNRGYFEIRNSLLVWIKNAPLQYFIYKNNWLKIFKFYIYLIFFNFNLKKLINFIISLIYILINFKEILLERKNIQKNRKVNLEYIMKNLSGSYEN